MSGKELFEAETNKIFSPARLKYNLKIIICRSKSAVVYHSRFFIFYFMKFIIKFQCIINHSRFEKINLKTEIADLLTTGPFLIFKLVNAIYFYCMKNQINGIWLTYH